ncbi:DUF4189 domain-containing protein [Lysobacter capsici]|uniref:DUF4189 domain-containing protein n=1 Tax=Lysobacter capsici TaxID=435897 RepID=UPI001C002F04|nr:DUF4189 domain-containing protein [Lysobacter capsici]QWF19507.1 DUF4189 domain-containing protein [Lysobacter capsici]
MKPCHATGLLLLLTANLASAEGACPPGQYQTTPPGVAGPVGCAPIPEREKTRQQWTNQWGALANDGQKTWGISESMPSKKMAISEAMDDCLTRGGKSCKLKLVYSNQCAAIVGTQKNSVVSRAATKDKAINFAADDCRRKAGNNVCWTYYSGCSLPIKTGE